MPDVDENKFTEALLDFMEKTTTEKPSPEQIKEWVKRDLIAASYFLNLLQRYPDVIDKMAEMIYEHAMTKENGAAVDHLKPEN